ncbi:MAG: hypothetical protein ACLR6B_20615 [Blautia sp.]
MVLTMEYGEDEMLLALCHYCFVHEKYDEVILLICSVIMTDRWRV